MQSWIESFRNEIEIYNIPRKLKINEIKFEDFLFKDLITINFFIISATSLRSSQSYPKSKSPSDREGISR